MYTFCASIENLVTVKKTVIKPTNLELSCRNKIKFGSIFVKTFQQIFSFGH